MNDAPALKKASQWTEAFPHFVKKMLVKAPEQRSSAEQLLMHPFMALASSQADFAKTVNRVLGKR